MRPDPSISVDFVARLADAWDGRGRNVLTPPSEHGALLTLAHLNVELWHLRWDELSGDQRRALVLAARRAVELGRACALIFGAGR